MTPPAERGERGRASRYAGFALRGMIVVSAATLFVAAVVSDGSNWRRGLFVAGAIALLLFARAREQAAWPDVAALAVGALAAYVVFAGLTAEDPPDQVPQTVPVIIAADKATAATPLAQGDAVVVVAVEPEKAQGGTVLTYAATRYEATLCYSLVRGNAFRDVAITVARDDADKTPVALIGDLRGADTVYLLAAAKEEETTESGDAGGKEKDAAPNASEAKKPRLPRGCPPFTRLRPRTTP